MLGQCVQTVRTCYVSPISLSSVLGPIFSIAFRLMPSLFTTFPSLIRLVIGIVSTLSIITVVFVDGFSKPHTPGSLWTHADTQLGISNWGELGVAFGLLMAGVR
jgi:solute carrier family 32 (vesicular inhibitory amino acid transporter)